MASKTTEPSSFADFRLRRSTLDVLQSMQIQTPTPIQAATLPALLDGRDVVGQARTGSGKTLAFGIPAVEVVDPDRKAVQVLVLTPTRELAVQVGGVLDSVGAPRKIRTELIFGGRALGPQRDALRKGAHIVVGTPGRVLDLLNQGALWLDQVRFLVLDEADEMLDRGFAPDVERIIARTSNSRQTAMFSATVPDWVKQTAAKHLDRPVHVVIDPNPDDAPPIEHTAYDLPGGDKFGALSQLLDHQGEGSIIVFGRTKHGVKKLARQLGGLGYPVEALQGNLSQNARDKVMEGFRSGEVRVLLATNVAARGLDINDVELVVNYELPESPELLTHRVGRTGRMGREGRAITLLGPEDSAKWRRLEKGLGRRIRRAEWRGVPAELRGNAESHPAPETAPHAKEQVPVHQRSENMHGEEPEGLPAVGQSLAEIRANAAAQRGEPERQSEPRGRGRDRRGRGASFDRPERGNRREQFGEQSRSPRRDRDQGSRANREPRRDDELAGLPSRNDQLSGEAVTGAVRQFGRDPHRPEWAGGEPVERTGRSRRGGRAHQRHTIVCADCGVETTVPFRPDPNRVVYCSQCYNQRPKGQERRAERSL